MTLRWAGERAGRGRASLDWFDAALARRAQQLAAAGTVRDTTSVLVPGGRRPAADVTAATRRADAVADQPALADAFDDGALPAAHLDVITRLHPDRLLHLYRPDGTLDSTHPPPGLAG